MVVVACLKVLCFMRTYSVSDRSGLSVPAETFVKVWVTIVPSKELNSLCNPLVDWFGTHRCFDDEGWEAIVVSEPVVTPFHFLALARNWETPSGRKNCSNRFDGRPSRLPLGGAVIRGTCDGQSERKSGESRE